MVDTIRVQGYGWRKDKPDHRDHVLALRAAELLPLHLDLRTTSWMPPVYQQGQLGSCTGNAINGAIQYDRRRLHLLPDFVPSRLFTYYEERVIEGSVNEDAGAEIRDGIKACAAKGVPPEALWPYNIGQFARKPSAAAYAEAAKHQILQYARVDQTIGAMKACLAAKYPFVFGFSVYESFESAVVAKTGMVPMPAPEESILGGHAVLCVGYTSTGRFIVRNSWGPNWGDAGYCYMPFAMLTNPGIASDMWMITTTEA